jgi:hypothetical protein
MLFFAIVYLVEGIGQARVGIIYQPLSYYLKEIGWTALQVTAYFAVLKSRGSSSRSSAWSPISSRCSATAARAT